MAKQAPISMAWGWCSEPATIYMRPNAVLLSSILQETGYTTLRPDCQVSLSFRYDAGPAVDSHKLVDPRFANLGYPFSWGQKEGPGEVIICKAPSCSKIYNLDRTL